MKKTRNIIWVLSVMILLISACKKENQSKMLQNSENEVYWTQEDVEIQNRILAFQDKIKNNSFKNGEQMPLDDAIWNLEALINYNYSNPDSSFVNLSVDTTFEFSLPVNNGMVNYEYIADAAFEMEAHIVDFLEQMPNAIKFIIATDVRIKDDGFKNGTKTLTITTGYGSEYIDNPAAYTPFGADDYWGFGYHITGGCEQNNVTESDAAEEIESKINNPNYQFIDPYPSGSYVINVGIETVSAWDYPNPDDDVISDNWLDFLMYNESEWEDWIEIDGCLEPTEMNFYLQGTLDVIDIVVDQKQQLYPNDDIEFVYLNLYGLYFMGGDEGDTFLHEAEITFGKRVRRIDPTE